MHLVLERVRRYFEDDVIARDETFARTTLGIFFSDSMVVFEKRPRGALVQYRVGRDGS